VLGGGVLGRVRCLGLLIMFFEDEMSERMVMNFLDLEGGEVVENEKR